MVPVQATDAEKLTGVPVRMFVEVRMNICVMADVVRDNNGDLSVQNILWVQDPSKEEFEEALYNDPEAVGNLEARFNLIKNPGTISS